MTMRILMTASLLALPLAATAQDRDPRATAFDEPRYDWTVRAHAAWLNTDDLGDAWGGQVGIGFQPVEWFSADLRSGYLRADDEGLDIVPLEAVAMFRLANIDTGEPYAGVGVGHYFLNADNISTDDTQALFPLVGMDLRLPETKLRIFAEVRYMFFDDNISSDISSNMDGLGVNLGVTWAF